MPKDAVQVDITLRSPTKSHEGYRIAKDSLNWILQVGTIIQPGQFTKPENVGKEKWKDLGYFQSITTLIQGYHQRVALTSQSPLPESLNEATREAYKLLERIKTGLTVEITA